MNHHFFADYKKYVVFPDEENKGRNKAFDPHDFASHFIVTLTIYQPVIECWQQAEKFSIDIKSSLEAVLAAFNGKHRGIWHLELLELDEQSLYIVLALSSKEEVPEGEAENLIFQVIERQLSNPLYIGQSWYQLTNERGRVERKLFCSSFRKYNF